MAKSQKRSNREIKKPKKAKLKTPATSSSITTAKMGPLGRGKK